MHNQVAEAIILVALDVGLESVFVQGVAGDILPIQFSLYLWEEGLFQANQGPIDPFLRWYTEILYRIRESMAIFVAIADRVPRFPTLVQGLHAC